MRRRSFMAVAAGTVFSPLLGHAQPKGMPLVGSLSLTSRGLSAPLMAAFHQGLGEVGFVEGRNVAFEYRWAEEHPDRLPGLVAELLDRGVDLVTTHGGAR